MIEFEVHEDIIIDILTYLPVKSLVRFKSVSSSWNSLISSPKFAKWHLERGKQNNNINRQRVLLSTWPPLSVDIETATTTDPRSDDVDDGCDNNGVKELKYPDSISSNNPFSVRILGSCNGLMLLVDGYKNKVLWNPSTGKSMELPCSASNVSLSNHNNFVSGVGCGLDCYDYKVVLASISQKEATIEIYKLETKTWRRFQETNSIAATASIQGPGTSWNGGLHWLGILSGVYAIISFHLAEEKFMEILKLPGHYDPKLFTLNLGLSKNKLFLFCEEIESSEETGSNLVVFEANNESTNMNLQANWNKQCSVSYYRFPGYTSKALCVTKNYEVVEFDGWELASYKPEDSSISCINIHNVLDSCESGIYVESLVSP